MSAPADLDLDVITNSLTDFTIFRSWVRDRRVLHSSIKQDAISSIIPITSNCVTFSVPVTCSCVSAVMQTRTRIHDTPVALTQTCKRMAIRNDTYEHMHLRLSKKVPADCEFLPLCLLPPPSGTTPS
jgi:hypothetical protein